MPIAKKGILQKYDFTEDEVLQSCIITDLHYAYYQDLLTQLVETKVVANIEDINDTKHLLQLARIDGKIDLLSMLLENHDKAIDTINRRLSNIELESQIQEARVMGEGLGDNIRSIFG